MVVVRAVLTAVLACGVSFACAACAEDDRPDRTANSGSAEIGDAAVDARRAAPDDDRAFGWEVLPGGWSSLPDPPFARSDAVSLWTGEELLLVGGDSKYAGEQHADGAVYDPDRGAWRPLPAGPLAPRASAAAVWTGSEAIIWGGRGADTDLGDGAVFDPEHATWSELPDAPLSPRVPVAAVWTGEEAIIWGAAIRGSRDGAAYDPARARWRPLPPAPLALDQATATWTGDEMLVFGALLDRSNRSKEEHAQGIAYDPEAKRWRVIAPYPLSPQASAVAWTGSEMLAWDYELNAATYDPVHDRWRGLPDLPLRFQECYPASARSGGLILAWYCGQGALFDIEARRWHELTRRSEIVPGEPVSAGSAILFVGASHEGTHNALQAFNPVDAARGSRPDGE
jgi:hypothetical protein